ncbi:MAG: DUF1615 family protein [Myxococcaceae bacterium]|nr:DUF1615 family protein [Myxococcaceae bacterium]
MRAWPLFALLAVSCVRAARPDPIVELDANEIARLIPQKVADREGWATDLEHALKQSRLPADELHVCSVIAVVDQESGFHANPIVPNLASIARREIERKASSLGPLARPVLHRVLSDKAEGTKKTFDQRLSAVRTEGDLDRLYRDIIAEEVRRYPVAVVVAGELYERNPITTAGSMQVSVSFSESHARQLGRDPDDVRDELYTRQGGLLYGTARLFAGGDYDEPLYRFADFNAGEFASRNAAFQEQLAAVTGTKLALDGDLLAYAPYSEDTETMRALKKLGEQYVRDAKHEKTKRFEQTAAWRAVKDAWRAKYKREPAYARLPDVKLDSPKLSRELTTAWFAKSVQRRYDACVAANAGKN